MCVFWCVCFAVFVLVCVIICMVGGWVYVCECRHVCLRACMCVGIESMCVCDTLYGVWVCACVRRYVCLREHAWWVGMCVCMVGRYMCVCMVGGYMCLRACVCMCDNLYGGWVGICD